MSDETTTEQLAEIDRDMADIRQVAELVEEAQQADYKTQELPTKTQELPTETQELPEYTPPDGWRVLAVGEVLQAGDVWVNHEGESRPTKRVGERVNDERYIRPIEPQPEPEPQPTPDDPGGPGWRDVEPDEILQPGDMFDNRGRWERTGNPGITADEGRGGTYRRRIEQQPASDSEPETEKIKQLRSEVAYVQNLLGESRQRVTQLEDLVGSLRAINEAQEKAFEAAGKENTDLQHRLNVVATEWAEQAETIRRLQIELDAAQQVPQAIADRFEEGWNQGTARAVETIAEWLEPIRAVDNEHLANETLQHLPQIMRSLTGLAQD